MEFTIGGLCFRLVQIVNCHAIVHLVKDDSLGSFEVKDRLLIGRRFLNATPSPDFFNLGRISACFQFSGNTPDSRDSLGLIILVSVGREYLGTPLLAESSWDPKCSISYLTWILSA